jgi:hypothetical protein
MNNPQQELKSKRKYAEAWKILKEKGIVELECSVQDGHTIINMLRKEKTLDKSKPKGKKLTQEFTKTGIIFKLINDTSINNL